MSSTNKMTHRKIELWYGTPLWAVRLMLIVTLLLSGLFFTMAYHYDEWMVKEPVFFKYFFYFLGITFFAGGISPRNWQKWTCFAATKEGLMFPSDVPLKKHSIWLLVPWEHVGEIKLTRFLGGTRGPSIEILISSDEKI